MITGPSGVGKSTISQDLHRRLDGHNWLLWQADHCQPRLKPLSPQTTAEEANTLEARMFAANTASIAAYLHNGWSVVAELTVMDSESVTALHQTNAGRLLLIHLDCNTETLAAHLKERDTPVPNEWAVSFHDAWHNIELPNALRISVDDLTPPQVTDEILNNWN
ncbi:MAG TPA: AAA family ATPase [Microlunatus sp.]